MKTYIVRRLLLMIPTLLGITIVLFTLIQLLPGGPVEHYISHIRSSWGASEATPYTRDYANRNRDPTP